MKHLDLAIFARYPLAYAGNRLRDEAKKAQLTAELFLYRDIATTISDSKVELTVQGEIQEPRAVIFRSPGNDSGFRQQLVSAREVLTSRGSYILNNSILSHQNKVNSKLMQHLAFAQYGIPHVMTKNFGSRKEALEWFKEYAKPVVVKPIFGSHGDHVTRIDAIDALRKHLEAVHVREQLFQEVLTAGEDVRVIVLNGKPLGAMKRIPKKHAFVSNFSAGGSVEAYDLSADQEAYQLATKIAKDFGFEYVGIDLMRDNQGKWVCLETNSACQFEGFEKATGVNVAKAVIEYVSFHLKR